MNPNEQREPNQIQIDGLNLVIPETVWPPYQTGKFIAQEILPRFSNLIENGVVMDVGTGSGILALRAGHLGAKKVIVSDLNPEAVSATVQNWQRNSLSPDAITGIVSDGLEDIPTELEANIDLIISNPPVQPMLTAHENLQQRHSVYDWNEAARGGRAVLDSILLDGVRFLRAGGTIITSTSTRHGWKQTKKLLDSMIDNEKIAAWREIHRKKHKLAPFYDKYLPVWLKMQKEDNDSRIWQEGDDWFHDYILVEIKKREC